MTLNKPSIRVPASGARGTCRVRTQYKRLRKGGGDMTGGSPRPGPRTGS